MEHVFWKKLVQVFQKTWVNFFRKHEPIFPEKMNQVWSGFHQAWGKASSGMVLLVVGALLFILVFQPSLFRGRLRTSRGGGKRQWLDGPTCFSDKVQWWFQRSFFQNLIFLICAGAEICETDWEWKGLKLVSWNDCRWFIFWSRRPIDDSVVDDGGCRHLYLFCNAILVFLFFSHWIIFQNITDDLQMTTSTYRRRRNRFRRRRRL